MNTAAGSSLPSVREFAAPAHWTQIDFVSDLHLAPDLPRTTETWERYLLGTPADAVFILGDLFDTWVGDDARHSGFEARCAAVLARASKRCRLAFMAGNRDFLVGTELLGECSLHSLHDPTVLSAFGQRVLLSHGDALCLSDVAYQQYRAKVRTPQWQLSVLGLALEERRRLAAQMRHASEQRQLAGPLAPEATDIDRPAALAWLQRAQAQVLVHGHTHLPGSEPLAAGLVRHVLSDWDLDQAQGAPRAQVLRLSASGFERLSVALALQGAPSS